MITELHKHPNCTQFTHDLLDLVEKDMLVVLSPDQQRQRSPYLFDKLSAISKKCQSQDQGYVLAPVPYSSDWKYEGPPGTLAQLNKEARKWLKMDTTMNRLHPHNVKQGKGLRRSVPSYLSGVD